MLIGIGEATVFPVAMSLLADLYPGPKLTRSVAIFQSSAGVGVVTGSVLAASLGWRTMFELFSAAGCWRRSRASWRCRGWCGWHSATARRPGRRGLTSTLMLIVQTLLAFAIGPLVIGVVSDARTPTYGQEALRYALSMMILAPLASMLLLCMARRRIRLG